MSCPHCGSPHHMIRDLCVVDPEAPAVSEEEVARSLLGTHFGPYDTHSDFGKCERAIARALRTARDRAFQDGEQAGREAACRAICMDCRLGVSLIDDEMDGEPGPWHDFRDGVSKCRAAAIRHPTEESDGSK